MSNPTTNEDYWLHIVRNPYGHTEDEQRNARLHLANSFEKYRQQLADTERLLAESQAREKALLVLIKHSTEYRLGNPAYEGAWSAYSDSTALDAAIAKAKREENEACAKACDDGAQVLGNYEDESAACRSCAAAIRSRMADELKGGEQ